MKKESGGGKEKQNPKNREGKEENNQGKSEKSLTDQVGQHRFVSGG